MLPLTGAQMEVDYTEQLNFSDDDEQGSSSPKESGRWVNAALQISSWQHCAIAASPHPVHTAGEKHGYCISQGVQGRL